MGYLLLLVNQRFIVQSSNKVHSIETWSFLFPYAIVTSESLFLRSAVHLAQKRDNALAMSYFPD